MRLWLTGGVLIHLLLPCLAFAQPAPCTEGAVGCEVVDMRMAGRGCNGLAGTNYDSGWLPEGGDIQVRFTARLGGLLDDEGNAAAVVMDGALGTSWPDPLSIAVVGRDEGGTLEVAYGAELQVQLRYDLEYMGFGISDTVDIPVPVLDNLADGFHMEGRERFDELAFAQDGSSWVATRADMRPFTVFDFNVIRMLFGDPHIDTPFGDIEIPVDGGFRLDLEGYFEGRYQTDALHVREAQQALTSEDTAVSIEVPPQRGGYGASAELHVLPEGRFECEVGITLLPTLYASIANHDFEFSVPVDLRLDTDAGQAAFEEVTAHVALPDVRLTPAVLDLSGGGSDVVTIENLGEAELEIGVRPSARGITLDQDHATIPPGGSVVVRVELDAQLARGDADSLGIFVDTNDPDRESVAIGILGAELDPGLDVGPDPDGRDPYSEPYEWENDGTGGAGTYGYSAGCSTVSGARGWLPALGLFLGLAVLTRRRR